MVTAQPVDIRTGKPRPCMKRDCRLSRSYLYGLLLLIDKSEDGNTGSPRGGCIGEIRLGTAVSSSSSCRLLHLGTEWAGWLEEVQKPAAGAGSH